MEWIVLGIIGLIILIGYGLYVSLITKRNKAREALSSIDVQLRKRYDLVPNVLKIAGRFMTHEKELLEGLTELRAKVGADYAREDPEAVKQHLEAGRELQASMMKLFAVAENYPELRSAETMQQAQHTYNEVEGHIAAARRFYNAAVNDLNNACEIFPSSMIAAMIGVKALPFYEAEEAARAPVDADQYLS